MRKDILIVLRGGGDLASGAALRLNRTGFNVVILELEKPLAVRRSVSFSNAVYEGTQNVEGVVSRLVSADQVQVTLEAGEIPVLVDPQAAILKNQFLTSPRLTFVVDGRLLKRPPEPLEMKPALHLGLGPGFEAPGNCHAVIETRRGHSLGRVIWQGEAQADSGEPDGDPRRVLRAPAAGHVEAVAKIGDHVPQNGLVARMAGQEIRSPLKGVLRGLIHPSVEVKAGMKIGDVDPRDDPAASFTVSDKALAVGGGVLEAVLIKLNEMENAL